MECHNYFIHDPSSFNHRPLTIVSLLFRQHNFMTDPTTDPMNDSTTKSTTNPIANSMSATPTLATRSRNLIVAIAAIILGVVLATGINAPSGSATLATLVDRAIAFDVARSNDKPTMIEFYANWCTSCQAMAPAIAELEDVYDDRINFVMLNIDNTNWLPEMEQYDVDGIPHFVFLDAANNLIAQAIGEQPKSVFAQSLVSLIDGQAIAVEPSDGATSSLEDEPTDQLQPSSDPRGHGAIAPPV
jgi:thiol-disulfide isomerase/thioredoxin